MCSEENVHVLASPAWHSATHATVTCVQPLLELLDFIGGAGLPVDPLGVQAVHLQVVDELLNHQRHRPLVIGQPSHFHPELPGRQLRIELRKEAHSRNVKTHTSSKQAGRGAAADASRVSFIFNLAALAAN